MSTPSKKPSENLEPNRFAAFVVKRPCVVGCSVMGFAFLLSMIGILVAVNSDAPFLTNETSNDLGDIRTIRADAYRLATDKYRPLEFDAQGNPIEPKFDCGPFGTERCATGIKATQSSEFHICCVLKPRCNVL
eukprot:GABV01003162.1.p2 GENE.GABV01003162.1~~GABV01003162.1.p2  ORF type:complete len:133 (+),score=31.76 GABV01003162.1:183-581(+)